MPATPLPASGLPEGAPVLCDTRDMLMIHSVFRTQFTDTLRLLRTAGAGDRDRAQVLGELVLELAGALRPPAPRTWRRCARSTPRSPGCWRPWNR
jgi:hypothetical protein